MEIPGLNLLIPDKLAQAAYNAGVDIAQNSRNYPLLSHEFSQYDTERIARVKTALHRLPLTHSNTQDFPRGPIKPDAVRKAEGFKREFCNKNTLDESLGLDNCVFMQWGAVEKSAQYGSFHTLISPKILSDRRSFVTIMDITNITFDQAIPYDAMSRSDKKAARNEYLSKILPGVHWLELIARQVYTQTRGGGYADLENHTLLGEIKYYGTVPESSILQYIGRKDEHAVWKEMFKNGFVAGPVARSQYGGCAYDVTPQQLGLKGTEAADFWQNLYI